MQIDITKLFTTLISGMEVKPKTDMYSQYVGKYVIVRSRNEGVNAGEVVACDSTGVILKNARRLWHHKPVTGAWYQSVAKSGLNDSSKISEPAEKLIVENYSITVCSDVARLSIKEKESHSV